MGNEKVRTFSYPEIQKKCFQYFQDMRNKKELCDITFQLGDEAISAHKIVITAVIPYFREIMTADCKSGDEEMSMPDVEPRALKCLVEFAYTCELTIAEDNVWTLLSAACLLRIDEVRDACCDFLADTLEPQNVLAVREVAQNMKCIELVKKVDCYVKRNFKEISELTQFLEWPSIYLKDIVGQKDLYAESEEKVLDAVVRWVKEYPEDRKSELPELLKKIRMSEIRLESLAALVEREELIRTSVVCRDLIDEAKHYNLLPKMRKDVCSFSTEPRQSQAGSLSLDGSHKETMYRLNGQMIYHMERFDMKERKWLNKANQKYVMNTGSAAELHRKMYFFNWSHSLEYDPACNSYKVLSQVPKARLYMEVTSFGDRLYVFGGRKGSYGKPHFSASAAVECFNPEKNEWTKMHSMTTARWGLSVVNLWEFIYIFGGRDETSVYDYAEKYDPLTDKWRKMSPMRNKRSFAGAAPHNGKIYVCGGLTTLTLSGIASSAEVYDPTKDNWTFICPMNNATYELKVLSCRKKLYSLGGSDRNGDFCHSCHVYDPESDTWTAGAFTDFILPTTAALTM